MPKIAGSILGKFKKVAPTNAVSVSWSWYDENNGIVQWIFKNNGDQNQSVILYRNGYYFGNAYYPVYVANPSFNTKFLNSLPEPLKNQSLETDSPPLAVIDFNGKMIVAFVFTLEPEQTWSMLEGGFSQEMPPENPTVFPVSLETVTDMCIGYSEQQILDWDIQTHTTLQGFSPNPSTIRTAVFLAPPEAPYISLFNDYVQTGACKVENCFALVQKGFSDLNIELMIRGIECIYKNIGKEYERDRYLRAIKDKLLIQEV